MAIMTFLSFDRSESQRNPLDTAPPFQHALSGFVPTMYNDKASIGFVLNVERWRGSSAIQRMSFSERGVFMAMLCEQFTSAVKSLPDDAQAVAELIAVSDAQTAEVLAAWPVVRRKFLTVERKPFRIFNATIEEIRRRQARYRKYKAVAGQRGGKAKAANVTKQKELLASNALAVLDDTLAPSSKVYRNSNSNSNSKREREKTLSLACASEASSKPETPETAEHRAGRLREELYPAWYGQYRHGAKLRLMASPLEFQEALTLVQTWDDARLEKLARIVLTTDDPFIANTDRSFRIFALKASWADNRLTEVEHGR